MRYLRALITTLILSAFALCATAAGQTEASKTVDTLHQALLDIMKRSERLGYRGRYSTLDPIVAASYDFPTIARIVVGRYWPGLKPDEQKTFLDTFARLSTATYASRFDSYAGESFRCVGEEKHSGDNVLVKCELVKSDGEIVKLDYVLHPDKNGQWRIVNVIADGISDLSLKRADYTSIMKKEGYGALIAKLNDKIAQYETPPGGTAGK